MNMNIVERYGRKKGNGNMLDAPSQVVPHDRDMPQATARAIHPAAAEAAQRFSDMAEALDRSNAQVEQLTMDVRVRDHRIVDMQKMHGEHAGNLEQMLNSVTRERDACKAALCGVMAHFHHIKTSVLSVEKAAEDAAIAAVNNTADNIAEAAKEVEDGIKELVAERREPAAS